jgi:hypothetical protein
LCWFDAARGAYKAPSIIHKPEKQACQDGKKQLTVDTNTCARQTADEKFYLSSLQTEVAKSDRPWRQYIEQAACSTAHVIYMIHHPLLLILEIQFTPVSMLAAEGLLESKYISIEQSRCRTQS